MPTMYYNGEKSFIKMPYKLFLCKKCFVFRSKTYGEKQYKMLHENEKNIATPFTRQSCKRRG